MTTACNQSIPGQPTRRREEPGAHPGAHGGLRPGGSADAACHLQRPRRRLVPGLGQEVRASMSRCIGGSGGGSVDGSVPPPSALVWYLRERSKQQHHVGLEGSTTAAMITLDTTHNKHQSAAAPVTAELLFRDHDPTSCSACRVAHPYLTPPPRARLFFRIGGSGSRRRAPTSPSWRTRRKGWTTPSTGSWTR